MTRISSPPATHFGAGIPPGVQTRVRAGATKVGTEFAEGLKAGWASPAKTAGVHAGEALVAYLVLQPLKRVLINDASKGLAKRSTTAVRERTRSMGEWLMDKTRPARNAARKATTAQGARDTAIITGGVASATYIAAQKSPAVRTALGDAARVVASAFKRSNPATP